MRKKHRGRRKMGQKKRPLTDEESAWCNKGISRLEEDKQYQQYLVQHANLMLSTGLKQNYNMKMAEHRIGKRDANKTIMDIDEKIRTLRQQLKYGVKTK